jgi:hypothetical protein
MTILRRIKNAPRQLVTWGKSNPLEVMEAGAVFCVSFSLVGLLIRFA